MFDVNALVNQPVEAANSTVIKQVPAGEYMARIADLDGGKDVSSWFRTIKGKKPPYNEYLMLGIPWLILDEGVRNEMKRDKVIVTQDIFISVDDAGKLVTGEGENVDLGRIRAALGLNTPGFSFAQLPGSGPVKVMVTMDTYDPENPRAKVTRVAKP
jgi:hypothetical protein